MGLRLLKLVLNLGKLLGVSPCKPPANKIYPLFLIIVLMVGSAVTFFYKMEEYSKFTQIKRLVNIILDVVAFIFTLQTILIPNFRKTGIWIKLIEMMRENMEKELAFGGDFFLVHCVVCGVAAYNIYAWVPILGLDYFKQRFLFLVQLYCQFFYCYMLSLFLRILLKRYSVLNSSIVDRIQSEQYTEDLGNFFRHIEDDFFTLKVMIGLFNEVFGVPILFIILNSTMLLLEYLDNVFKNDFGYQSANLDNLIASNIMVLTISFIGSMTIILLSSMVRKRSVKTVSLCYRLQRYHLEPNSQIWEQADQVIGMAEKCLPKFTAGRFLDISNSIILDILTNIFVYLIVTLTFTKDIWSVVDKSK